jgi:hypothetical protein
MKTLSQQQADWFERFQIERARIEREREKNNVRI